MLGDSPDSPALAEHHEPIVPHLVDLLLNI